MKTQIIPLSIINPPNASIQLIIVPKIKNSSTRVTIGDREQIITDLEIERYLNE